VTDTQINFQSTVNENSTAISAPGQSRFLAFFDECGDHSLDKIDRDFPLFVLALVLVERSVYQNQILPEFNNFKLRYFGSPLFSVELEVRQAELTSREVEHGDEVRGGTVAARFAFGGTENTV